MEASKPKWVNPVLKTIGVNLLRLGSLYMIRYNKFLQIFEIKFFKVYIRTPYYLFLRVHNLIIYIVNNNKGSKYEFYSCSILIWFIISSNIISVYYHLRYNLYIYNYYKLPVKFNVNLQKNLYLCILKTILFIISTLIFK